MIWFLLVPFSWYIMYLVYLSESVGSYPMIHPFHAWVVTDWVMAGFFIVMISFAVFLVSGLIATAVGSIIEGMKIWTWVERGSETLVSVRDKDGVSGSVSGGMFILSGSVNSSPYYFYYTQNSDGSYEPGQIKANSAVRIFEGEEESPRLVVMEQEHGSWWPDLFGFVSGGTRYHFYVPTGTVRREMSL